MHHLGRITRSLFHLSGSSRGPASTRPRRFAHFASPPTAAIGSSTEILHTMPFAQNESLTSGVGGRFGNFDLVKQFDLDYTKVSVSKWRSRLTGLTLLHLGYDAPIVKGYFVVASEIFDDSGRPHTLEHLVFMGSEKYPYKGVLDQLANRAFSEGTNAWTDQDHTAYTLATAGSEGFLRMLPVYMDHILYPTLIPEGFVTEVHHIDAEGQDSGVVYSEMQGRQNTSGDIMSLKMQQILNPPGSAYRSETAGLMEALRVLNNEQIKGYHKTYYVPYNMVLVVAGNVETSAILETLQREVEPSIISHKQYSPPSNWKRPFVGTRTATREPLSKSIRETVEFPEQDESTGEVLIGFSGPAPADFLTIDAIGVLGTYLTSSATAPVNKEFVEVESPLCTYIYSEVQTRVPFCDLFISAGGVPMEHLETFEKKLRDFLVGHAAEGIDMKRMGMILERDRRKFYNLLESSKGDTFSNVVIEDFLYGDLEGGTLAESMDAIRRYSIMEKWTSQDWTSILQKYFIDSPAAVVSGKPSASLADRLSTQEQSRISKQIEELGPDGLARATVLLTEAKAVLDRPIPSEIISNFQIPDVKNVSWIPVQSYRNEVMKATPTRRHEQSKTLADHLSKDGGRLPFFVQFDHVESDFVTIHALFSLKDVPKHLLPYLSVYQNAFFTLPVELNSRIVLSHDEVVDRLDRDTVSYGASLGFDSTFPEMARVSIKVETKNYELAIKWLHDLMYGAILDVERLKVTVAKMLQSLPEAKRDGESVLGSTTVDVLHDSSSALKANSLLAQMAFLPQLAEELQSDPTSVVTSLAELRGHIYQPASSRFAVAGNVMGIPSPKEPWRSTFSFTVQLLEPVPLSINTLSAVGREPSQKAVVVTMPSIESSFSTHIARGIAGFDHPDWPALRVALELLNSLESYLWRYIRGSGLAYGAMVGADLEAGQVSFSIFRSPNAFKAFEEGAKVLAGLSDGSIMLDTSLIESAKSSIVYSLSRKVATPSRAALTSFVNQEFKGISQEHHKSFLQRCQEVEPQAALAAIRKYLLPIFSPSSSIAVVVSSVGKAEEITTSLADFGYQVERRTMDVESEDESDDGSSTTSE